MKRYTMERCCKGRSTMVLVHLGNLADETRPLHHIVRHSPDGFEWGYGGSGPADLALALVADVLDDPNPNPHLYQRVKSQLVAPLPREGGEITEAELLGVLAS